MAINTRDEMKRYALELCVSLMERTAKRRLAHEKTLVNDSAGYVISFLESFCRPLWGIGPILAEDGPFSIRVDGQEVDVCRWIRQVLLEDITPGGEFSWDKDRACIDPVSFCNQTKTELAGLLLGIWFARQHLWEPYTWEEKERIAGWIHQVNQKAYAQVWDCNHVWFVVLNLTILKKLGFVYEDTMDIIREGLSRMDAMYEGGGFYRDGKFGRFDYYNPWAMHTYPLLWCMVAGEDFPGQREFLEKTRRRVEEFLPYYVHAFDETGCHIPFGRSLAYRFAASCLFPAAVCSGCHVSPGLARGITLKNISYFQENARLEEGVLPPGFLYSAPQTVENYTSDGGAYWCTKAFLALLMPEDHPFWTAPEESLPAERGPFRVTPENPRIRMILAGEPGEGVVLYNNTAHYLQDHKKTQFFLDMAGFYSKFAYHSRAGFGISTRDSVSFDGTISLTTPDGSLESHRFGFEDLGEQNGFLVSRHFPFSNDPATWIVTWLLPLKGSLHVRVHQVALGQKYVVREGGFTLPLPDDFKRVRCEDKGLSIASREQETVLWNFDTIPKNLRTVQVHPGMHLLEPCAYYPGWETDVLEPGNYLFVSVFDFRPTGGKERTMPQVEIRDGKAAVHYEGKTFETVPEVVL